MDSFVFDERGALERVAGDRALLSELIRMALEFYRSSAARFSDPSLVSRDAVLHAAHRLRSSFGNVGAVRVSECAERLYQAVLVGADSSPILAELAADVAEFEATYSRSNY